MKNVEQLLNIENWVGYLELATEGGLTDVAIANDIVSNIAEILNTSPAVDNEETLKVFVEKFIKACEEGDSMSDLYIEAKTLL